VHTGFWWGDLKGEHLEHPGGRRWEVIIKMDLQEVGWRGAWTGSSWLSTRTVAGCFECDNEPSGSMKNGEFLD
jgi:hypothetical protein